LAEKLDRLTDTAKQGKLCFVMNFLYLTFLMFDIDYSGVSQTVGPGTLPRGSQECYLR